VMNAARKFRYVPNVTARTLRAKSSGTKHVVVSILTTFEAPLFLVSQALRALDRAIAERKERAVKYDVNLEMFHAGRLHELSGLRGGRRWNGAIVTNTIDQDDQFLAVNQFPFPVVLMGRRIPGYPSVSVKSDTLGRKAADILTDIGRRKLAVLQPAVLTQATRSRLAAFVTSVEHKLGLPPMMITCETLHERSGYEAMRRFLSFNPACDGVFATTDSLAIGAYLAIKRSGRTVPGDIALVGVGDNPASDYMDPPLTCFEYTEEAQNRAAANLLLDLVNGVAPANPNIEVPVSPLLRESTGHTPEGAGRMPSTAIAL
jgi:LacI family transcriptional regulator